MSKYKDETLNRWVTLDDEMVFVEYAPGEYCWEHSDVNSMFRGPLSTMRPLTLKEANEVDSWYYTNADRTEARRGRWVARVIRGNWALAHDDIPDYDYTPEGSYTKPRNSRKPYYELRLALYRQMRDFLAWHAAQTPAPPAVPEVGDYIRAELRSGAVEEFEVTRVRDVGHHYVVNQGEGIRFLPKSSDDNPDALDILHWTHAARPKVEEPTGLGAVVEIEWRSGRVEQFILGDTWRSADDGEPLGHWYQTEKALNVTIKTPGVDS